MGVVKFRHGICRQLPSRGMLRPPVHPTNHELAAKPWLQHLLWRLSSVPICTSLKESLSNQISSVIYIYTSTYIILYVFIYHIWYIKCPIISHHLTSIGCTMMYILWSILNARFHPTQRISLSQRAEPSRRLVWRMGCQFTISVLPLVTRHSSQLLSSGLAPLALDVDVQWIHLMMIRSMMITLFQCIFLILIWDCCLSLFKKKH